MPAPAPEAGKSRELPSVLVLAMSRGRVPILSPWLQGQGEPVTAQSSRTEVVGK